MVAVAMVAAVMPHAVVDDVVVTVIIAVRARARASPQYLRSAKGWKFERAAVIKSIVHV